MELEIERQEIFMRRGRRGHGLCLRLYEFSCFVIRHVGRRGASYLQIADIMQTIKRFNDFKERRIVGNFERSNFEIEIRGTL